MRTRHLMLPPVLGRWLGTVGSLSAQNDSFGTLAGNPYGRPGAKIS